MKRIIIYITIFNILFILKILSTPIQNTQKDDKKLFDILKRSSWINSIPEFSDSTIIILDFWATWCAPCISSFPHLNELEKNFRNKSLLFISATSEKRKIVESFLKRIKLNTFILLDSSKELHSKYNISAIPRLIIINSKGETLWDGHPMLLKDSILKKIILNIFDNKTKNNNNNILSNNSDLNLKTDIKNLNSIELYLRPSKTINMSKNYIDITDSGVVISFINKTLCNILKDLLSIKPTRFNCIFFDSTNWDLDSKISFTNEIPKATEMLRNILISIFSIKIDTVYKQAEVYKIFCSDSSLLNLYRINPDDYNNITHSSSSDSLFSSANISLDDLCYELEDIFNVPFLNCYKTINKYNFTINILGGIEKLKFSLLTNYGLQLRKEKENIDFIKIEKE